MSDVEGVLDDKKKLIPEIDTNKINELITNKVISVGMIPKIRNCLEIHLKFVYLKSLLLQFPRWKSCNIIGFFWFYI